MFRICANKISVAASALLLCAGFVQAQTPQPSPIGAAPTSVAITFQLPSTAGNPVSVALSTTTSSYTAVVSPSYVPSWLTITGLAGTGGSGPSGTVSTTPLAVGFQANANAAQLPAGTYAASIHFAVSGFQDLVVQVSLAVQPAPSLLSVLNGGSTVASSTSTTGAVNLTWVYGDTTMPSATLTVLSTDTPTAFTAVAAETSPTTPANWTILSASSGIGYNFGTPITVTFLPDVLKNAAVGSQLTSNVTINYTSGSTPETMTIDFTITIAQPFATVTSIFPAYTPVQSSGSLKVVVTGTGFYAAGTGITATAVTLSYASSTLTLTGAAVSVVSQNTMVLTIPYQDSATPAVGILSTVQPVGISVTNALTINAVVETAATATLHVTQSPIIYSVTDAGALQEAASGTSPKLAPYELISIFGSNFCPSGCATPVVAAVGAESRYPQSLSAGGQPLSVNFNSQAGTLIAQAYLIFANNTQINALVPSTAIASASVTGLQVVVESGSNSSAVYTATPVAANPGLFTTGASGQGQGAILLGADYSVNSSTNPALNGSTVLIYASGLGVPNSTSAISTSTAKAPAFPTSCFLTSAYVTDEGLTSPATADGAVLVSTVWGVGNLPPCFATKNYVTVTINGVAATVDYAGWVSGSVAGLYQINATVPAKATTSTTAVSVPVSITANGVASQSGVTMYIKQ